MLLSIKDSTTKLGNVFQYATLLGYCSYKVPENKVILQGFYDWILNFLCCSLGKSSSRRSAIPDVSALIYNITLCRIFVLRLSRWREIHCLQSVIAWYSSITPPRKQKSEVAKSCRNCKSPDPCNLWIYYVDMQAEFHSPAIFCITPSMYIACPLVVRPHQRQPSATIMTTPRSLSSLAK